MKQSSQRIAIAKVCGWTTRPNGFQRFFIWVDPDGHDVGQSNHEAHMETAARDLPDYPNDLNAMHKAEDALGDGYKRVHYLDTLCWVCRRDGMNVRWLEAPFANAAQKAEAFLYVFGLWEDSESQREAAGTADGKPDGQAENADGDGRRKPAPPRQ